MLPSSGKHICIDIVMTGWHPLNEEKEIYEKKLSAFHFFVLSLSLYWRLIK